MSPEREALILVLETLRELEQEQHDLLVAVTAVARASKPTSQSVKDPLPDLKLAVGEELARYAPDARIRALTDMIQLLRA
jgi:hypothetical protein